MDRRQFFLETTGSTLALGGLSSFELTPSKTWRVLRADVPNSNKRLYTRDILESIVEHFQKENKGKKNLMGMLGMGNDAIIHFSQASHIVNDLKMDGDYLVVEIEVLNTPCGEILKKMISSSEVAFRTAGIGGGETDQNGIYRISKDFKLITVNAVSIKEAAKI